MELKLFALGPFTITFNDRPLTNFRSEKIRAILAYLILERDHSQQREKLAGMFWPDQPEDTARANLRVALFHLRRTLEQTQPGLAESLLRFAPKQVQARPVSSNGDETLWFDVAAFHSLLSSARAHGHADLYSCQICRDKLQLACDLYRGALLQGFSLQAASPFDEWLAIKREAIQQQALNALQTLTDIHLQLGSYVEAEASARRLLAFLPWHEPAHRSLMQILTATGRRGAALNQYDLCSRILRSELGVPPEPETTALYERIKENITRPPELTVTPPPHNLPALPATFIGREESLQYVAAKLNSAECRLISVLGMGGSGKTWLAIQAAWAALDHFPDGVYFVSLSNRSDIAESADLLQQVPIAIANELGLALRDNVSPLIQVSETLRTKHLLLVLDNLEYLQGGAGVVSYLLQAIPKLKVIATSREQLHLMGEWTVKLEGLDFPHQTNRHIILSEAEWQTPEALDRLAAFAAVRLLLQRVWQIQPGFRLTVETAPEVARLCELVEGWPLALELAAAQFDLFSPAAIVAALETNLAQLDSELLDRPERHQSLQLIFESTWQHLLPAEKQVLQGLSNLQIDFTALALDQVSGATRKELRALIHKSILQTTAEGRFRFPELFRRFVSQKFAAPTL